MANINLDYSKAESFFTAEAKAEMTGRVLDGLSTLMNKTGAGNDFLGWIDLPVSYDRAEFARILAAAERIRSDSEVLVVIGIGGSYLGARAVIEALSNSFGWLIQDQKNPTILFAGNNIGEDYLFELTEYLKGKKFGVINISKSGTTTETALTFRLLKKQCEQQRGKDEARKVIVAVTDAKRGAARTCADKEGYKSFIIPDNVGGRFSVLTPVGLLPIAIAGLSIRKLLDGAKAMRKELHENPDFAHNPAMQYALLRHLLYNQGLKVELMASFEPKFFYFIEWFKQLFGESEGKELKGIFPAGAIFSTDLHSLGQYIQEGTRQLFETVLTVEQAHSSVKIPYDEQDTDGLNYLQHRTIDNICHIAQQGTCQAHVDGKVPNIRITIPEINEYHIGELIYFFEMSCAISGYMLKVNPFDQPGVEAYKRNMFRLLGKPGYEKE